MNLNMSIYRQLNPKLLVQIGLGLGLLHWANICLIYISNRKDPPPSPTIGVNSCLGLMVSPTPIVRGGLFPWEWIISSSFSAKLNGRHSLLGRTCRYSAMISLQDSRGRYSLQLSDSIYRCSSVALVSRSIIC